MHQAQKSQCCFGGSVLGGREKATEFSFLFNLESMVSVSPHGYTFLVK